MTQKNKIKKYLGVFTAIVVLFTCVLNLGSFATSDNAKNPKPKEEAIKSKIHAYFNDKNAMLATLTFDPKLEDYFTDNENVGIIAIETEIEHRKMQISDLKYLDYQCDLEYIEISPFGNTAKISVIENNAMTFKCSPDVDSQESYIHQIDMKKTKGEWLIVSDEHGGDFYQAFKNYKAEKKSRSVITDKTIQAEILAQSRADSDLRKEEYAQMKEDYENGIVRENNTQNTRANASEVSARSSQYCLSLYNREAAQSYAYKYWDNPNPAYINMENLGGNCTNFTSQCLKAGGIVQDKTGSFQWYYDSAGSRAPAWSAAQNFRNYYQNNIGSSSTLGLIADQCSFQDTRLGDLVQFVRNNSAYHTMIITGCLFDNWAVGNGWEYKYDVLITQNSTEYESRLCNVVLSTRIKKHQGAQHEFVQIIGSCK